MTALDGVRLVARRELVARTRDRSFLISTAPGAFATLGLVLSWFLLGYAFYIVLFAVAGAVGSRQEELQNATTLLNLALVASFLAALSALGNPGGTIAQVASFLLSVAPLVMPV